MTAAPAIAGVEFEIRVPPGWWQLPVTSSDLRTDVAAVVDARLVRSPEHLPQRDAIVDMLESATREAQSTGALFCAQVGIVEGEFQFSAGLIVALRPIPGLTSGNEVAQLEGLTRAMAAPGGTHQSALLVERMTSGPMGEGVRHRSRRVTGGIEVINVSYWFPVRDTPLVAVVNASSPNVSEAEELVALFDEIVGTLVVSATLGKPATAEG